MCRRWPAAFVFFLGPLVLPQLAAAAVWSDVPQADARAATAAPVAETGFHQRLLHAEPSLIAQQLLTASTARARSVTDASASIELPMPNGSMHRYSVENSPVMAAEFAAKFPEFKSYKVYALADSAMSGRVSITPLGFHAYIDTAEGTLLIDPVPSSSALQYRSYYKKDYALARKGSLPPFSCGVHGRPAADGLSSSGSAAKTAAKTQNAIRVYRIAVATTGEYSQAVAGGDPTNTLAEVFNAINRVNQIYERDLGVRLELVANNDQIIFTDSATDDYTNDKDTDLLVENQIKLDSVIGTTNYDIGHVFSTGGGGLARLGVVCDDALKARGETGSSDPVGDPFYIDYVAHEIGHQFNAEHSFNGTTGACAPPNRSPSQAWEPGSGVTVMSYAGICGSENIANNSDAVFHAGSIGEIAAFTRFGAGASCSSDGLNSTNVAPVVDAGLDYTIPGGTYFELSGSATDAELDPLLYHWDEMDIGVATNVTTIGKDLGSNALFRSYNPGSSADRTFPSLDDVLNNAVNTKAETLPTESRTLHFRLTATDNKGGVNSDDMQVIVASNTGPFRVLQPNTGSLDLNSSSQQVVEWNAACTEQPPVNCANVDILYSGDGGTSFVSVLDATPNDGEEPVNIPAGTTSQARIMIRCSDNIFYDISDADFSVTNGAGQALLSTGSGGSYNCGTSTGTGQSGPDIESNDSISLASFITIPITFNGTVNSATDIDDYYVFTAGDSKTYAFNLSAYGSSDLDLYLIDSSFNLVASSESFTASTESFNSRLIAGSTYYLRVTAYDTLGSTSAYTLSITQKKDSGGGSISIFVLLLIMVSRAFRMAKNHTFANLVISCSKR
jgi:hypothetical protein